MAIEPLRMAVFVSGNGTNLQAIMDACVSGRLHGRVVVVVSNEPGAGGIRRARAAGIPVVVKDHREFSSREEHEKAILKDIERFEPKVAVLAGYMRVVTPVLLEWFYDHERGLPGVVNIHPADTRQYQGTKGYEFALGLLRRYPERLNETKITVHFVDAGVDTGPIIAQEIVPVLPGDTLEDLKQRGLQVEHELYPRVLDMLARHRLRMESGNILVVDR